VLKRASAGTVGTLEERAVAQRFEAKYLIRELEADAIRDFIEPYTRPDDRAAEYPVTSLYLDSPDLAMFRSSNTGEKNRHKLRLRTYDDDPNQPVFFEIKQRVDQVILKHRAAVSRAFVDPLLEDAAVTPDILHNPGDTTAWMNLLQFRDLMTVMQATPRVTVRYLREAFISDLEEPVRVTFDRYLTCLHTPAYAPGVWAAANRWRDVTAAPTILEIKFTDTYPSWIAQLVRRFSLLRWSFAKYVVSVKTLQVEGIRVDGAPRSEAIWGS